MTKVILLTVDALRKDVAYGDEVDTPNISQLMSEGQVLDYAYANGPNTSRAYPAILCSSKLNDIGRCPEMTTLAEAFQEKGFETIGISTNPHTSPYFGYGRGFDTFTDFVKSGAEKEEKSFIFRVARRVAHSSDRLYELIRKHRARIELPYERAETLNREFFSHLKEGEDQFFFLHYMDTHYPYFPPEGFADTDSEAWMDRFEVNRQVKEAEEPYEELTVKMWELYRGEVRYLDSALGELFQKLGSLDEEVVILFTADHGEQFGEHGAYLHPDELHNVQLNVPFIVKGLEVKGDMASHLDIGPTLLGHVGGAKESFDGLNLLEEERHAVTVSLGGRRCVITPDWKLVDDGEQQLLFDSSDYLERENLAAERESVVRELEPMLGDKSPAVRGIEV